MAHPETEIQVYASFPYVMALGADLNVDADNWHWVLCIALPLETLDRLHFSPRLYKWIRYAIGSIVGAEGDLSFSPDSLDIVDYNACLPTESATLYYHTSDDEKRRMFPLDPNLARTSVTSSAATTGRAQFRSDVTKRDGNKCVLTGTIGLVCDAVHLLAHSKADSCISTYTRRRSREHTNSDLVHEIDSVRNGLLLNKLTHVVLGQYVAFLPTPNFAMNTTDIDPTALPEEQRCTAHLFEDDTFLDVLNGVVSGTPLRISDTDEWPPAILFDAVYACAVLHHFGTKAIKDEVAARWVQTFYPDGVTCAERKQKRDQQRQQRHDAPAGPDALDLLMDLPYILVSPEARWAMWRAEEEKAEAAKQRQVQEKVETRKRGT